MPKATGATIPRQTIDFCRQVYETTPTSFRKLERAHGISHRVLHDLARSESWVKFERSPTDRLPGAHEAREAATEILVNRLKVEAPKSAAKPTGKRGRGRPKAPSKSLAIAGAAPQTPEQTRLQAARVEFEAGGISWRPLAKKYGFSVGKLRYVSKMVGWGTPPEVPPDATPESPADRLEKPGSAPKGWSAVKATRG
jgi:hypothetical protein